MKNTNKTEYCPHCNACMKEYWQTLSSGLVENLIKAIKFVKAHNKNSFHPIKDLNLSNIEYNNFQKLRFHGLIRQDEIPGNWAINKRGGQFLRGEINVPKKVKTFRNEVIGHSPEVVNMKAFRGLAPEFETSFAYEIKDPENLPNLFTKTIKTTRIEIVEGPNGEPVARKIVVEKPI